MEALDVRKWVEHGEHVWIPCLLREKNTKEAILATSEGEGIALPIATWESADPVFDTHLKGADDVCELPAVNACVLLHTARVRYAKQLIYTRVQRILICLNPFQPLPIYSSHYLDQYASAVDSMDLPPHIFGIGADALKGVRDGCNCKDQAIVISGESGAGKTESCKLIMSFVTEAAKCGNDAGLDEKILQTNPILEAFGNAMTVRNNNSSRFGKWLDMKFSATMKLLGCHITHYLLETTRVCSQAVGERCYHIFFQLMQARSEPEFKDLHVQSADGYEYLKNSELEAPGIDDGKCFDETRDAFSMLGFSPDDIVEVFKVVTSVLTLGNIQFSEKDDVVQVVDDSPMKSICALLQVEQAELTKWMLTRKFFVGAECTESPLKLNQAIAVRDSLSKELYGRLFALLIEKLNTSLQLESSGAKASRLIGILDIAGFESFEKNSLEQLLINLSNEHLQQHFNSFIFKAEFEDYKREGLQSLSDQISFNDNSDVLALLDGKGGILDLLDEEVTMPRTTDQSYSTKVAKNHAKAGRFVPAKFSGSFGISHYAGIVSYSCDGFLAKNVDKAPDEAMAVLATSKLALVRRITEMSSFEPPANSRVSKKKETGTSKFRSSLRLLMAKINNAEPHFIRCIKPNKEKVPSVFNSRMVMDQLLLSGCLEAVRIRQYGFSYRVEYKTFVLRYSCLGKLGLSVRSTNIALDAKALVKKLCEVYGPKITGEDFAFGTSKIFTKTSALAVLDPCRATVFLEFVIVIQKTVRGRHVRKRMEQAKSVYAELRKWLGRCCPHVLDHSIQPVCLLKSVSLEVAEQELVSVRDLITKVESSPIRPISFDMLMFDAENAEKSLHAEIETLKQVKDARTSGGIDPVPMDKCLARARGLGLSFCEDFQALEARADQLRVQLPLVQGMKNVLDQSDVNLLLEVLSEVKKAGLGAPPAYLATGKATTSAWLPELDGASLYARIIEEAERHAAEMAAAEAKRKAEEEEEARRQAEKEAEEEARRQSEIELQRKADEAKRQANAGIPPPFAMTIPTVAVVKPGDEATMPSPTGTVLKSGDEATTLPGTRDEADDLKKRATKRATVTGLGPAAQAVILHNLDQAADEYDAVRLEELLSEATLQGIAAVALEDAKKIFAQLQHDAFLVDAVEEAKRTIEEAKKNNATDELDLVVMKRLLNLSDQIRKIQGDFDAACSAVQEVQAATKRFSCNGQRKSVFMTADPEEKQVADAAFKDLRNFKNLKAPNVWKGHQGFALTSFETSELKENMLSHSKIIIAESLTQLPEELQSTVIENFRDIMIWMGDKTVQECQRLASQHDVVECGAGELTRDEVYVQVLKQLTRNPSPRSALKGWQLLLMLCQSVLPSEDLIEFVRYFVSNIADDSMGRFAEEATSCARDCLKVLNGEELKLRTEEDPDLRDTLPGAHEPPLEASQNTKIAAMEKGTWEYICVDTKGFSTRSDPVYVKQGGSYKRLNHGEVVEVCERGKVNLTDKLVWLKLSDGRGWAVERTKQQRMSEISYGLVEAHLEKGSIIIRPDLNVGVKLMQSPIASSTAPYLVCLQPGTPVIVQAKADILAPEGTRSFYRVLDDLNNEGWIPLKQSGKVTLVAFKMEKLKAEQNHSLWISVLPGKRVPVYSSPGRASKPNRIADSGNILEVAPERLIAANCTFYRFVSGGWFSEANSEGKIPYEWVEREAHWMVYSVAAKAGAEIRRFPTREAKQNTGKQLKQGQEITVSEKVTFSTGDCFVCLEPPFEGWVPLLRQGGDSKLVQVREVSPRTTAKEAREELTSSATEDDKPPETTDSNVQLIVESPPPEEKVTLNRMKQQFFA